MLLPVHIIGDIEGFVIFLPVFLRIPSAVHHTCDAVLPVRIQLPGFLAVIGQIRTAAGEIIQHGQLLRTVQDRMLPAKSHRPFHEGKKIPVLLSQSPVKPVYGIVLTVGIVVSSVAEAEFISTDDHGRSLCRQQQQHGILHLPFSQPEDRLSARFPFEAAVPAEIAVAAVPVILPVRFIVLSVIGNQIRQTEAGIIGHIIYDAGLRRVPLQAGKHGRKHIFISLQKATHGIEKAVIIGRQVFIDWRFIVFIDIATGHILIKKLGIPQHRLRREKGHRHPDSQQMEAVHMIFQHPVTDHLQNIRLLDGRRKIKLHDQLDSRLMKRLHQALKLLCRMIRGRIGILGRKIIALLIPPVIDSGRLLRLRILHITPLRFFHGRLRPLLPFKLHKFAGGHQLHRRDSQLLQIGNLLPDSIIGSPVLHPRAHVTRKSPHMQKIQNAV